jgi:hypothetical protein
MFAFLEEYYAQTAYEQIGVLLGELKLNSDGIPGDPAAWDDWLISIEKVLVRE